MFLLWFFAAELILPWYIMLPICILGSIYYFTKAFFETLQEGADKAIASHNHGFIRDELDKWKNL